jgi:hypothetical protein
MADGNDYSLVLLKDHGKPVEVVHAAEGSPLIPVPSGVFRSAPNSNAARLFQRCDGPPNSGVPEFGILVRKSDKSDWRGQARGRGVGMQSESSRPEHAIGDIDWPDANPSQNTGHITSDCSIS